LKDLERAFGIIARILKRRAAPARRVVGDILGSEIARLLTDEAFDDAGVFIDTPSERDLAIIRARSREPEVAVAEDAQSRRAELKRDAATVLANFHARCHALIAAQLEIERGRQGGRPSDPEREFVLANIAIFFEDIFGVPPTASEAGSYAKLCEDVLELYGLETKGVEYAAKRVLSKLRRRATSRPKPRR